MRMFFMQLLIIGFAERHCDLMRPDSSCLVLSWCHEEPGGSLDDELRGASSGSWRLLVAPRQDKTRAVGSHEITMALSKTY